MMRIHSISKLVLIVSTWCTPAAALLGGTAFSQIRENPTHRTNHAHSTAALSSAAFASPQRIIKGYAFARKPADPVTSTALFYMQTYNSSLTLGYHDASDGFSTKDTADSNDDTYVDADTGTDTDVTTIGSILKMLPDDSYQFSGLLDMKVTSIVWDYQKVSPGSMFFCFDRKDYQKKDGDTDTDTDHSIAPIDIQIDTDDHMDGLVQTTNSFHHWIDAVGAGATCLVCRKGSLPVKSSSIGLIEVDDPRIAFAFMSSKVF